MYPKQHNQPMVQMHPSALFEQTQTYTTQQFVANQRPQAETQNPNGSFIPMVRSSAKFGDVCGKIKHTASQCWWRQKPQKRRQNFPFPNEPKKLVKLLIQPPKSSKSTKSSSNKPLQPDEIISLYAEIPAEGTVLTYTKINFSQRLQ